MGKNNDDNRIYEGWQLPSSHSMIVVAGKGLDRAQGTSEVRAKITTMPTWGMLVAGREAV